MASINMDIDVDIDAFDDDEIIEYLTERIKRGKIERGECSELLRALKASLLYSSDDMIVVDNLADVRKMEYIAEIFHLYTVEQLQEKLK